MICQPFLFTINHLATTQCVKILFDPKLSSNSLCTHVPFDINCNSVYVTDMSSLINPKNILYSKNIGSEKTLANLVRLQQFAKFVWLIFTISIALSMI